MSADNEVPSDSSSAQRAQDSRRKSIARQTVKDGGRRRSYVEDHAEPPNVEALSNPANDFVNNPSLAREWANELGDPPNGGLASQRLAQAPSGSVLPFLTHWLEPWYARKEKARRDRRDIRSSRPVATSEGQNLEWLFQFICDYVALEGLHLQHEELNDLCGELCEICFKTSRHDDVSHSIEIFYSLALNQDFPEESLRKVMIVLCSTAVLFPEWPSTLLPCVEQLAQSSVGQAMFDTLYDYIASAPEEDLENVLRARGAARFIQRLLTSSEGSAAYDLETRALIDALHQGALRSTQIKSAKGGSKLSAAISDVYHALLTSYTRRREVLSTDLQKTMQTIATCSQMMLPVRGHDFDIFSMPPEDRAETEEDRKVRQSYHRVRTINEDLEQLWQLMSIEQRQIVYDYFMAPQIQTRSQSLLLLKFADERQLCWPSNSGWQEHSTKLFEVFIKDPRCPSLARTRALQVYSRPSLSILQSSDSSKPDSIDIALATVRSILGQIVVERNSNMVQELLKSLNELSLSTVAGSENTIMKVVLKGFEDILLSSASSTTDDDMRSGQVTTSLVDFFLHGAQNNGELAQSVYETLLKVAGVDCHFRAARITAMRLLFCIRADSSGSIFIQHEPESEYIAAALCKTQESADAYSYDPPTQRSSGSSSNPSIRQLSTAPSWMMPEERDISSKDSPSVLRVRDVGAARRGQAVFLDISSWLFQIIRCLQADPDWETYSYVVVHLGAQLVNVQLFKGSLEAVVKLRQVLCEQTVNGTFREPPSSTGLKKSDIAMCIFNVLTQLIPYATMRTESIQKGFGDDLVRAFISGIGNSWEGSAKGCINALSVCSLELPSSVASGYPTIIDKLSKNMTQTHLSMHILEFLAQVGRLPEVHSNFNMDEITMIFGICIQFLEKNRDYHTAPVMSPPPRSGTPSRHSGVTLKRPPYRAAMMTDIGLKQYASALAYHTMIFWFLSLGLEYRAKYASWIVPRLVWKNPHGEQTIDEQSQVFIDMMQRTAFSDLGETIRPSEFSTEADGVLATASWIVGLSIVTAETAGHTGKTLVTKRQASGTTHAVYQQLTAPVPSHHAPSQTEIRNEGLSIASTTEMLPSHILLQMVSTAAPTGTAEQPLALPKSDAMITRALEAFDRIPTVDSHKIGVLYIGQGQTMESEYLANTSGSADYETFLRELGYVVSLQPPRQYNAQGLEYERDGTSTIAWRDRVTEIVYHVPTMMPTNTTDDPQCIAKKAHVGNCHVNIIFNRSTQPWIFDNFKSQLNYVNIVIVPATQIAADPSEDSSKPQSALPEFYKVHVLTKPDFPNISPAAEPKAISAAQLPHFVRVLALNANTYCEAWNVRDDDTEFHSSWRTRLQQIKTLKERVSARQQHNVMTGGGAGSVVGSMAIATQNSRDVSGGGGPSGSGGRRTPVPREERDVSSRLNQNQQDGVLASMLDFSRWTI